MAKTVVRSVGRAFLALHRRLLPPNPRIGWVPYLWLFWLIGFFAKWWFVPLEPVELTLALLTLPVFLALYLNGFWHSGRRVFVNIAGILLIALVWTPFNPNAMGFFIYASGFVGRADRPPRAYRGSPASCCCTTRGSVSGAPWVLACAVCSRLSRG